MRARGEQRVRRGRRRVLRPGQHSGRGEVLVYV
jgi:hypothetical protein